MSTLLLKSGRVIDPFSGLDEIADVLIEDGTIKTVATGISGDRVDTVIDCAGYLVTPGWIDAHVHLRDPGLTYKEDLQSGALAALAGGFTRMCCMPNTVPALDTPAAISDIVERGAATGVHIHPIGTITVGRLLHDLAPLDEMASAGAIGFSDDGESTVSEEVMRAALRLSTLLNRPIMVHCEDPDLARGGSMHRGDVSRELGDPGIPAAAEENYIERDIRLAEETGGWLHVLHVSTVRGAEMVRAAKDRGVRVTAEVMPHHLTLTDDWVAGRRRIAGHSTTINFGRVDTNAKVNPPLRPESDAIGLLDFVLDGTFDFIATDHAPHAERDKPETLSEAASGMSGLELAIPTMSILVSDGRIGWAEVVRLFTLAPAQTLNLAGGTLAPGAVADVTVIDPSRVWKVTPESIKSRSKNTPFLSMDVTAKAIVTILAGEVRHDDRS